MLRNLSDYLSLFTLLFMCAYSIHIFVLSFISRESDDENVTQLSRRQLLAEYLDNEEE